MPLLTTPEKNKIAFAVSLLKHIPMFGKDFALTYEYGTISLSLSGERDIHDIIHSKVLCVSPTNYNEMIRRYNELTLRKFLREFERMSVLLYKYDNYIELTDKVILLNYSTIIDGGCTLWGEYSGKLIQYLLEKAS